MHNNLDRIAFRVQILAIVELAALVLVLSLCAIIYPDIRWLISMTGLIGAAVTGVTYWLRHSPFIELIIYGNIFLILTILAIIDPLSGTLSGSTWTLYQIWPPTTALILRSPRSTAVVLVAAVGILVTSAILQISGVISVELTVRPELLWLDLGIQILVLITLASIISAVTHQQQQSFTRVVQLSAERQQQLDENQHLLKQQAHLNQDLRASLEQVQLRDAQLHDEQTLRRELLRTVDAMAVPVIPISDDIVVAPLVGSFYEDRLALVSTELLDQIGQRQARVLILDVTGLSTFDTATAQTLLTTVDSCRLMGTQTMLVGIHPEMAQTIVGLGIELEHVVTRANLQEAIRHALTHTQPLTKS
ncbi:MAG: STAS domain-containing protein [Oscillochloris sp.]|nr:STAS domain-containing protein [Oscillochloris sp.]